MSDEKKGERAVAVVARDNRLPEAARDLCRARQVGYRRPSRFVFKEELPRNALGKVLKRELRHSLDT